MNITSVPSANYAFGNYTYDSGSSSGSNPFYYSVTANDTVWTYFTQLNANVTFYMNVAGATFTVNGTSESNSTTVKYASGTVLTLTATPPQYYGFLNFQNSTGQTWGNPATYTVEATNDTLWANFGNNTYNTLLCFTVGGNVYVNGTLTANGTQLGNIGKDIINFTAVPNSGYQLVNYTWTGAGNTTTNNPFYYNVTASTTMYVYFQPIIVQITIQFYQGVGGNLYINGTDNYANGTQQLFNPGTVLVLYGQVSVGYAFQKFTYGSTFTTVNPFTYTVPTYNDTVTVYFVSVIVGNYEVYTVTPFNTYLPAASAVNFQSSTETVQLVAYNGAFNGTNCLLLFNSTWGMFSWKNLLSDGLQVNFNSSLTSATLNGVALSSGAVTDIVSQNYTLVWMLIPSVPENLVIGVVGQGSTSPSVGFYTYTYGTVVNCSASANVGYVFSYWLLNGTNVGSANPYALAMTNSYSLVAVFVSSTIIVPTQGATFYFRSDTATVNNVSGYSLGTVESSQALNVSLTDITGNVQVSIGFRVYLLHQDGSLSEVTGGSPVGVVSLATDQAGYFNGTWLCPYTSLTLGFDALQINVYMSAGNNPWILEGQWITARLLNMALLNSSWYFNIYLSKVTSNVTVGTFQFGSSTVQSCIYGIQFSQADVFNMMLYMLESGNFFSFILFPFTYLVGNLFYGLVLLLFTVPVYVKYRDLDIILLMLVLFGGAGGFFTLLIPAAGLYIGFVIMGLAFGTLLYRVFR